jgi:hypothetical protein
MGNSLIVMHVEESRKLRMGMKQSTRLRYAELRCELSFAGLSLGFCLLSGNVWIFDVCRSLTSDLPECCRNGFCPHHHHGQPSQDSPKNDCECKSRDPQLLTRLAVCSGAFADDFLFA